MLVYILPQRRRLSLQKQPEHAKALAVAVPQADLVQKAERLRVAVQQKIPVPAGQVDALELRYPLARQPGARRAQRNGRVRRAAAGGQLVGLAAS